MGKSVLNLFNYTDKWENVRGNIFFECCGDSIVADNLLEACDIVEGSDMYPQHCYYNRKLINGEMHLFLNLFVLRHVVEFRKTVKCGLEFYELRFECFGKFVTRSVLNTLNDDHETCVIKLICECVSYMTIKSYKNGHSIKYTDKWLFSLLDDTTPVISLIYTLDTVKMLKGGWMAI